MDEGQPATLAQTLLASRALHKYREVACRQQSVPINSIWRVS
jgi:hypothetical protein